MLRMTSHHPSNSLSEQIRPVHKHLLLAHAPTLVEITLEGAQSIGMQRLYTHTAHLKQRRIQLRVLSVPTFLEQRSLFLRELRLQL